MKTYLKKNIMMMFVLGAALLFTLQVGAQTNGKTGKGERRGINNNSNNLFGW